MNANICGQGGTGGGPTNLNNIVDTAGVFLTCSGKYAYQPGGSIVPIVMPCCRCDMQGTQIGTYPQHLSEGLNWGCRSTPSTT